MADIRIRTVPAVLARLPEYPSAEALNNRRTGRTTAQAIACILTAMTNEGLVVKPKDHSELVVQDEELTRLCREMVEKLGLRGFTFSRNTLVYKYTIEVTIHG